MSKHVRYQLRSQLTETKLQNFGSSGSDEDGVITLTGGGDDSGFEVVFVLLPACALAIILYLLFALFWYFNRLGGRRIHPYRKDVRSSYNEGRPGRKRLNWRTLKSTFRFSDTDIITHTSLDAYMLLRNIKLLIVICFAGCLFTWPVLLPLNSAASDIHTQLNRFSLANSLGWPNVYYGHALCAWIFVGKFVASILGFRLTNRFVSLHIHDRDSRISAFHSVAVRIYQVHTFQNYIETSAIDFCVGGSDDIYTKR